MDSIKLTSNIKVVVAKIASGVGGLDNHPLSRSRPGSEGQLITSATPILLSQSINSDSGITVGQVSAHAPRGLVVAHESGPAITSGGGGIVGQNLVLSVTGVYWMGDSSLFLTYPLAWGL